MLYLVENPLICCWFKNFVLLGVMLLYHGLDDPFYPCRSDSGKIVQVSLEAILLGECQADPIHPDPALEAFLRYLPSLILQLLEIELTFHDWHELAYAGVESSAYPAFRQQVKQRLTEHHAFFGLYATHNGFYQHFDLKQKALEGQGGVKIFQGENTGLDGLLVHGITGNNHCHRRRPALLQQLCVPCALTALIHHNYFCVSGLAGPGNLRGNQAYLCLIAHPQSFQRMIRNTYFPKLAPSRLTHSQGWMLLHPEQDQPSWLKPTSHDWSEQMGLRRALLYTPRHAFFEIEPLAGECSLCGLTVERLIRTCYWGKGEALEGFIGHPTLATYREAGVAPRPLNYTASLWRSLPCLALPRFAREDRLYQAAPLVQQWEALHSQEASPSLYSLELMAYQTDQAKLLGFYTQSLSLPLFGATHERLRSSFYRIFEDFTKTLGQMLWSFQLYGKGALNRHTYPLPNLLIHHDRWSQQWGTSILKRMPEWLEAHQTGALPALWQTFLFQAKQQLQRTFAMLCHMTLDDSSTQRHWTGQKRRLAERLQDLWQVFAQQYTLEEQPLPLSRPPSLLENLTDSTLPKAG